MIIIVNDNLIGDMKMEEKILEALRRAYFLLETNNIKDEYFETLRVGLGNLLPSQVVDAEVLVMCLYIPGIDEAAQQKTL